MSPNFLGQPKESVCGGAISQRAPEFIDGAPIQVSAAGKLRVFVPLGEALDAQIQRRYPMGILEQKNDLDGLVFRNVIENAGGSAKDGAAAAQKLQSYAAVNLFALDLVTQNGLSRLIWINADPAPIGGTFKFDLAGLQGEQGVISADSYVNTRMKLGAPLAHKDVAGLNDFAAVLLDAKHFRLGVASVSR